MSYKQEIVGATFLAHPGKGKAKHTLYAWLWSRLIGWIAG